ncbi:MAG TPA: glycerol-3-phosphate dehydrogenase/oxidase, partial [Planctomycetaceae bacterium]|nr:glycerol-3-phosphate dehydrogenase/oxidase [Planctomycetaceae bacterium]
GKVSLVRESLRERERLLKNASHLVHELSFVLPAYKWWERGYYGLGLKMYDWLAGRQSFGKCRKLSASETQKLIPGLNPQHLRGGVLYHDGQFDDARLVINLMQTAAEQGAACLNYCRVERLLKGSSGKLEGVEAIDAETGDTFDVRGRCVINATGPFSDGLRTLDDPEMRRWIAPSRGIHLVLDESFLGGKTALLVPKTDDGRVIFAIPWVGRCVIGTTDTPVREALLEPHLSSEEVDFLLETAGRYLSRQPTREDILSTFSGVRPLVNSALSRNTSKISREHAIEVSPSGLLTIAGGKWTTYRKMAEDGIDQAIALADLPQRECVTHDLKIHGCPDSETTSDESDVYGSDRALIQALIDAQPEWGKPLGEKFALTRAEVVWGVRAEMARTVEDVLSRRSRVLVLDARDARVLAEPVARIMAEELGRSEDWRDTQIEEFQKLADRSLEVG